MVTDQKLKNFFTVPKNAIQKKYEALRRHYVDGISSEDVSKEFHYSINYFNKIKYEFSNQIELVPDLFFVSTKTGPKKRFTNEDTIELIISLRKKNHSIQEIQTILEGKNNRLSLDTINRIIRKDGFSPLPKRTKEERSTTKLPLKLIAPNSIALILQNESFSTEQFVGPLIMAPLIEELGIVSIIESISFPKTSVLSDVSSILAYIALKIIGNKRLSHDSSWSFDRSLGLFANLNVLPKNTTMSSYSYRITREQNRKLLLGLSKVFQDDDKEEGVFNLDFKAIPHWGNESVLEKNWSGSRTRAMKSILGLIVQDPSTGYVSYTNTEFKHDTQNNAVLEFVDFWKEGRGIAPKMLVFDSKFTSYKNLDKLNQSDDGIKFLTLRRRGNRIIEEAFKIPDDKWKKVKVEGKNRKHRLISAYDGVNKLRGYKGEVREIILKDHGRSRPTFMITNDFKMPLSALIKKYAQRWLVELEIAEQIDFFHLNTPSSSIVIKVDFDLTISLLVHNLYRKMATYLPGFSNYTVSTLYRNFLENGARITIENKNIVVKVKKKSHVPILFELPWLRATTKISWLDASIKFEAATYS